MCSPYKACLFDLDGTLADTLGSIASFGNAALQAFGLPPIEVQTYRQLVGNGADVLMQRMLKTVEASLPPIEQKAFRKEYDRLYESDPLHLVAPYPGLPGLLGALREEGFLLGVLSNKPDNMTCFIARELYGDCLSQVRGQRPGSPKKPDPTVPLEMAAQWGLPPQAVLYIGDSGVDMDTGRHAGMDTCGVLWGFRDREELLSHGAAFLAEDAAGLGQIIRGKGVRYHGAS